MVSKTSRSSTPKNSSVVGRDRRAQPPGAAAPIGVVDVDDERHRAEAVLDLGGDRAAGLGVGAVDLGEQRRQHRRPGRRLDHLQRWCPAARRGRRAAARMSSAMAWLARSRSAFGSEVDLHVALLGLGAQVVVAHQAVEVERRGGAGIGLDRAHLGQRQHGASDRLQRRASVASTDEPSGRSTTTASSDLLSKGSSLTVTCLGVEQRTASRASAAPTTSRNSQLRALLRRSGRATAA